MFYGARSSVVRGGDGVCQAQASYVAGFHVPLPLPPGPPVRLDWLRLVFLVCRYAMILCLAGKKKVCRLPFVRLSLRADFYLAAAALWRVAFIVRACNPSLFLSIPGT